VTGVCVLGGGRALSGWGASPTQIAPSHSAVVRVFSWEQEPQESLFQGLLRQALHCGPPASNGHWPAFCSQDRSVWHCRTWEEPSDDQLGWCLPVT
jgi:hypothetical protein